MPKWKPWLAILRLALVEGEVIGIERVDSPWQSLRSRHMGGTWYQAFWLAYFSSSSWFSFPSYHTTFPRQKGYNGLFTRAWKSSGWVIADSRCIWENEPSHSPSNFTDNMPTLNPLKTVVEHDIVSRVVIAFCEEELGCVSVFLPGERGEEVVRWFV